MDSLLSYQDLFLGSQAEIHAIYVEQDSAN